MLFAFGFCFSYCYNPSSRYGFKNSFKEVEVKVNKVDEDGVAIEGVKFQLRNRNTCLEGITDVYGNVCFYVSYGEYELEEMETLPQLHLHNEVMPIVVDRDEAIEVVVENVYKDVEFIVYKVNEDNEPLKNAKFILKNDSFYQELITNEEGIARCMVHYGEYSLEEIEAPSGYQLDYAMYPIIIDECVGSVYEIQVTNNRVEVVDTAAPQVAPWIIFWVGVVSLLFLVYLRFYS